MPYEETKLVGQQKATGDCLHMKNILNIDMFLPKIMSTYIKEKLMVLFTLICPMKPFKT